MFGEGPPGRLLLQKVLSVLCGPIHTRPHPKTQF
jgi:hypothetical protein